MGERHWSSYGPRNCNWERGLGNNRMTIRCECGNLLLDVISKGICPRCHREKLVVMMVKTRGRQD